MRAPAITKQELERLLGLEFPEIFEHGDYAITDIWHGGARVSQTFRPTLLRPGGTVSGAALMTLADLTMYVAVLASIGWVPLAVTTNMHVNFLRKPAPRGLEAECRLLKLGKRLAVGEILMRSEGEEEIVAHATSTYSIPTA
jgi:uncharacterized protein (TIGR00369 family)